MAKAPSVVIVARHGARLDQADKQWINTSATPYDPPLTYGGWTQSRALGARIASALKARERAQVSAANSVNGDVDNEHGTKPTHRRPPARKPLRHKIIIHTSPYLRCVQTAIGISAGMAQWDTMMRPTNDLSHHRHHNFHSSSGRLHSAGVISSPHLEAIPEPIGEDLAHLAVKNAILKRKQFRKSTIRIDAFLGEWLQPDYFELISQPPDSKLMVAAAKSELLRRGDYSTLSSSTLGASSPSQQGFPGGWKTPPATEISSSEAVEGPLMSMSVLADSLPQRDRASSHSSAGNSGGRPSGLRGPHLNTHVGPDSDGYVPPTPTWAVSPSDPIPAGYVAHARDSCVEVDYQWDSMRSPQSWGDGGEYGEEWASMHKRFRKGINNLVKWYSQHDTSVTSSDMTKESKPFSGVHEFDDNHVEDVDTVVIIVTHGAGCNALLGALTDSPVLMDIGLASLSMAIRKDPSVERPSHDLNVPYSPGRRASSSSGIADDYDVVLSASTEHLRAGSNPLAIPLLQSPGAASPKILGSLRHRLGSESSNDSFSIDEPALRNGANGAGISSSIGSIRRVASTSSSNHPRGSLSSVPATGLWSPQIRPAVSSLEMTETGDDDLVLNFDAADYTPSLSNSNGSLNGSFSEKPAVASVEEKENASSTAPEPDLDADLKRPLSIGELPSDSGPKAFQGLWGTSFTVREEKKMVPTPKRRWTVDERPARK